MSKVLPAAGTYPAKTNGKMVVYETQSGALCVAVPVVLTGVDWSGKTTITIAKKDGTLQTRSIDNMKQIFGWDGANPFDLEDMETAEIAFTIVGEHENYIPEGKSEEVTVFKIKWINPINAGAQMPQPVQDRKAVLSKWGSKFKAIATPSKANPVKKVVPVEDDDDGDIAPVPVPVKVIAPRPVAKAPRVSSGEEIWTKLCEKHNGLPEDQIGEIYYAPQDELFNGRNDLSPVEWGQVADKLGI